MKIKQEKKNLIIRHSTVKMIDKEGVFFDVDLLFMFLDLYF